MAQFSRTLPQCDHTSLNTNSLELSPIELIRASCKLLKINVWGGGHLPGVDLENARTCGLVGERELDFAVETPGTEKGRIEDVDSVCSCYDLDPLVTTEPIKLIEQFQHRPLYFPVTAFLRIESLGTNSVQFVDENDGRGLFLRQFERVSYKLCTIANEHLYQ